MPHIDQDSELFTNYIAAKPVLADGTIVALKDRNNRPALITLGATGGVLHLYTEVDGRLVDHDFGAACGIKDPVQSFAARQLPDHSIFLVIASKSSATAPIDFCVLPSLKPIDLLSVPTYGRITTSFPFQKISKIVLSDYDGTTVDGHKYPDILVVETPSASLQIDDCKLLQIVPQPDSTPAVQLTPWALPFETDQVLDVAFGHSKIGNGIFVLYKDLEDRGVAFVTYGSIPYCNIIKFPVLPTCLTSYLDPKGHSNLLIAGSVIHHYTPSQYIRKDDAGTPLRHDWEGRLQSIHVAQHQTDITIWCTDSWGNGFYYHTAHASIVDQSELVILLSTGQAKHLSGMLMDTSTSSVVQAVNSLIAVGSDSTVSYMTQASKGGAWTRHPLTVSSDSDNHPVPSYMTRLCIKDDDSPVPRATFRLKATGRVDAILNGQNVTIEEGGSIFQTNMAGQATFVIPTNDMASFEFYVSDVYTADKRRLEMNVVKIDPSWKSRTKLATLNSVENLKAATLPDGTRLIPADVSYDELKRGAESITQLHEHAIQLMSASPFAPQSASTLGFSFTPKSWFHWVEDKAHDAVDWGCKLKDGIASFAMKIGNELYDFALDSIHSIGKGLSWVMKKLKAKWEDFLHWLDLFFHWKDIKTAKHSFQAFINAGLDFCISEVQTAEKKIDGFFKDIQSHFKAGVQAPPDQGGDNGQVPKWLADILSSVKFTWVIDQLLDAGGLFGWPIDFPEDDFIDIAWKTMGGVCQDSYNAINLIAQSFLDNFKTISKTPSAREPLNLIQNLLTLALDAAKTMADGILEVAVAFLNWFKKYLNTKIKIPVFTALFPTINLPMPSVLDVMCLIMAIPSTYASMSMNGGHALPDIKGVMERNRNGGTIKQYIEGTLSSQDARNINFVAAMGSLVLGVIGASVGAVILGLDADPESVNLTEGDAVVKGSFSTQRYIIGNPVLFNSPAAKMLHGPKLTRANTVCQWVNCLMGLANVGLAFPIKLQSVVWLKWANWGFMVGRWSVGLIITIVGALKKEKFSVGTRAVIAGIDLGFAVCQFGSQMVLFGMADETWTQRIQQIRTSIFYLLGTTSRSTTVWFEYAEQEELAAITIIGYGVCQFCTALVQVKNLMNVIDSWKLDVTIEWVEGATEKVNGHDGTMVVANNKAAAQELFWFPWSTVF